MNSELRKWLFALGVVLSSCSFALGFLPAADRAEVPAESAKDQEETLYLHRPQLTIALSHSPLTIQDSHSPFAIHYSPHTGAFLVTPPAPASANLSPRDFNQVSASIFDPVNNAIRINANLTPGGTHTPNDANQVFTSIFNATNNAIQVNCVAGCSLPINVATDSPGFASIGSCTITLTNASNTATASSNCFSSANVGTILQANLTGSAANCHAAVTSNTPCFRAVITAVSGTSITLGAYFPGSTTSGIAFNSGPAAGDYNLISDACGQYNASLTNHSSSFIDGRGITGNVNCSISPWNGLGYGTLFGYASLAMGQIYLDMWRPFFVPNNADVYGLGKGQPGPPPQNTFLEVDPTYWTETYEAVNVTSTNVVTTAGTATFADHPSSGNSTLMQTITSTTCMAGTSYGLITINSPLTGWTESSQVHIQGVTGNTGWNGIWMLSAVSGLTGQVQFNSTCPTTGTITSASVDVLVGDEVQGSFPASTTDVGSTAANGSFYNVSLSTGSDFSSSDVGSCTLKATGGTFTNAGPFTVAANASNTVDTILTETNPGWSSATITRTCWVQGTVNSTSFNSGTQTVTLTTVIPMQQTCSSCSMTYSIGGPVVQVTGLASTAAAQGVNIHDFSIDLDGVVDTTGLGVSDMQEHSSAWNLDIGRFTANGITCEAGCAHGMIRLMQVGAASNNLVAPTSTCVLYAGVGYPLRGIESITCLGNTNGVDPYTAYEISSPATHVMGNHCERFVVCFGVGRFSGGLLSPSKGNALIANDPGIGVWNSVVLYNGQNDVVVVGMQETNAGNALIVDNNLNASCGAGTTTLTDNGRVVPGIALYVLNTSASAPVRFTSDPAAANCFGGTATGLQCFASACGGSNVSGATVTLNMASGNRVAVNLAASVSTLTVNNSSVGQDMDLTVQENATGAFTFAFPSNFKGFTAITTTANQCNVYHAMYDGTNWVATAGVNSFAGPCL